jgi:hypothetical protein
MPTRKMAAISSDVPTGRLMNGEEMLMGKCSSGMRGRREVLVFEKRRKNLLTAVAR